MGKPPSARIRLRRPQVHLGMKENCTFEISECQVYTLFILRILKMASSCEEYRCQQQLLALKKRLSEDRLTQEEREELERLVQELENKLKM
jgi:hypothetical protein